MLPPILDRVHVGSRDKKVIQEWRDRQQTYAVFWTAASGLGHAERGAAAPGFSGGYRAYEIRGDQYAPLPGDKSAAGRARVHPTFEDAAIEIAKHWRFMTGKPPRYNPPSRARQKIEGGKLAGHPMHAWPKNLDPHIREAAERARRKVAYQMAR